MANSFLDKTGLGLVWAQIKLLLAGKVDKVDGKGLSSNDFTADEKAKLANIQAGAEANVNADWNAVTGDSAILNKPTIPTATSDLTNDSGYITINDVPDIPVVGSVIDYSQNAVESQAIYDAFDTHLLYAIDYNSGYPSTNEDLMKYTYISYYVQSLDDAVRMYRVLDGFSSIDGKYRISTNDYGETWVYQETGSSQTFSLSHVNEGFYPLYVDEDTYKNNLSNISKIFGYPVVDEIPSSLDDLRDADAMYLYDSSSDTTIALFNIGNNRFMSIYDNMSGNHQYQVYKNGSTWVWQKDWVTQGNLELSNISILKYRFADASDIPTNNNQLTNGAGYQTASDVNSLIATAIGNLEGVSFEIVQTLPATGDKSKIYLVPLTDSETDNIYEEYIWITSASDYEKIGTTSVDLTDYYNTTNLVPITNAEINTICQ